MKRFGRWVIRLVVALLAIVIVLAIAGVWFVRRPWPEVSGTMTAAGLTAPVKVVRDKSYIPHIYAQNEHDLFFTQGYVQAQDRLWQMNVSRHSGSGTLSELFGKATVDSDRYLRMMGLRRAAEQEWADMDPDSRAILEAYSQGVNAYIDSHRDRLPLEFTILGVSPSPWTPVDTLAMGNVIAMSLSGNYTLELLRAQMIAKLGLDVTQQLFPPPVAGTPIILPQGVNGYSGLLNARFDDLVSLDDWVGVPDQGLGSNDWVVSGSRTATGKPFLANDTHLALSMPSTWYENDLHGGRFNVEGFSFPGVPLVILGHNDHIAWGTSNLGNDVEDIYLEKLNDVKNPTQYEFKNQWIDLQKIPETINVKGGEPVKFTVLLTRHGPILNADNLASEQPTALRWTLQDGNGLFESVVKINLAANWKDFHEAVGLWDVPGQNFVYADVDGNIGYQASGKTPIRVADHLGTVPVPGWTGENEWQGFVPYDAMPYALNPPAGFVATANNKITPDGYPYILVRDWYDGFRAQRITDMLKASDKLTLVDMEKIQADTYSLPAEHLRPYMLAVQPQNDLQTRAISELKNWDLRLEADRVGAGIYEVWFWYLVTDTVGDEMGDDLLNTYLAGGYQRHSSQVAPLMINLMADPENKLWDDSKTPAIEKRDDIIRRSLQDALDYLTKNCGSNMAGWQWGCLHKITFKHQFNNTPVLNQFFNGPTMPARGDRFTVDAAAFNASQPFQMVHGSSQRLLVDLGNLDNSLGILTSGESGQALNPHRDDNMQKWQDVEYNPLFFAQTSVDASADTTLMLMPAGKTTSP